MVAEAQGQARSRSSSAALAELLRLPEASIALVAIVVAIIFEAIRRDFLTSDIQVLLNLTAQYGMLAVGEAMLMITGEIDLSAANIYSATPFVAYYLSLVNVPYPLGALISLVCAGLIGAINGFVTVRLGVPSLIATLGMLFLLNGATLTAAHSQPVTTPDVEPFNTFFGKGQQDLSIGGPATYAGFIWLILIVIVMTVVLRRTRFGMHTISVGSNLLAAREIGIRTERTKILNFVIMGVLAGFAGLIQAISSASTDPSAGGSSLTLSAIAAAVIGGTSLFGGSGTIIGALIGAFVIALLNLGLSYIGAPAGFSDIPLGLAIAGAMILNIRFSRMRGRK